jgi:ketosteroid isomerase-like protein
MPTGPEAHNVDVSYPMLRAPLEDDNCPRSSGGAHRHVRPVFIALLATPLASAPLRLPAQPPRDAASRGIQAANDRSIVAYNAGDVSAFARVYPPNTTLQPPHAATLHGHGAIETFWQGRWNMGICDNKFGVRNHADEWIDVSYAVVGTSDRGDLTAAPTAESPFVTDTAGTTQVFYQGRVVASMANRSKACRSDP